MDNIFYDDMIQLPHKGSEDSWHYFNHSNIGHQNYLQTWKGYVTWII